MANTKTPPKAPAFIAAAVLIIAPFTASREGLVTTPHVDPAGYDDVCYGDRAIERRKYTPEECLATLVKRETRDYAPAVAKCVPAFADAKHKNAFAASIDAAYNAGTQAFCRSPMAAAFNRGDWIGGCKAFRGWRVTARGKPLAGLVRRREAEAALCIK